MDSIRRGQEQATKMREKAMNFATKRKEEFIGARVPKALKEKIINRANELDIPVSLLMRRVLEEVFLDGEGGRQSGLINSLRAEADNTSNKLKDKRFEQMLGWNQLLLNRDVVCEICDSKMVAGIQAFVGVSLSQDAPLVICASCKGKVVQNK